MIAYIKSFLMHSKIQSTILLSVAIIFIASLASYSPTDPSFNLSSDNIPNNALSYLGSYLSDAMYQMFGLSAFILPICMMFWSYIIFRHEKLKFLLLRITCMLFAIYFFSITFNNVEMESLPSSGGGALGITTYNILTSFDNLKFISPLLLSYSLPLAIIFFMLSLGIRITTYMNLAIHIVGFIYRAINKIKIPQRFTPSESHKAYYPEDEFSSININNTPSLVKKYKPSTNKDYAKPSDKNLISRVLPPLTLLDEGDSQNFKPQTEVELNKNAESLLSVLKDFGINGKIIDIREGQIGRAHV